MPFDGATFTNPATQVIDRLLEFFGGGKRWCKDHWISGRRKCLVMALRDVSAELGVECGPEGEGEAGRLIMKAMTESWWCEGLIEFNDACPDYREIKLILVRARELALGPDYWTVRSRGRVKDRRICDKRQLVFAAFVW